MAYLLDTHALLWSLGDEQQLSATARDCIEPEENDVLVSVASLWEIAVKVSIGKLQLETTVADLITMARVQGFGIVNIRDAHLIRVAALPLHHRDPFDRMLAAQALAEDMTIVSCDTALDAYGVKRVW